MCGVLVFAAVVIASFTLNSCEGGDPLLTDLTTTNNTLVIKGTYESNDPREWWGGAEPSASELVDDSVTHVTADKLPTKFLLDLGELKIDGQIFTTKRIYHYAELNDSDPFFSGEGVSYSCEDLSPGKRYDMFKLYCRKLLFDQSKEYDSGWDYVKMIQTQFEDKKIDGYNFVYRMIYKNQADADDDIEDDNYSNVVMNPLRVKTASSMKYNVRDHFVLEIRILVKNYIEFYELNNPDDDQYYSHYGLGDAINDVVPYDESSEDDPEFYLGGNVISCFNWYVKGKTAAIAGTAPAGTMVVAIPEDKDIGDFTNTVRLPDLATWCEDGTYRLEHARIGENYKVYYSTDTPDAVKAMIPSGFTGETLAEIEESDAGKDVSVNLN